MHGFLHNYLVAVEDLYQKERSSIVRWRVSNLCKTQHTFEVYYRSDVNNCKDSGRIIVEVHFIELCIAIEWKNCSKMYYNNIMNGYVTSETCHL